MDVHQLPTLAEVRGVLRGVVAATGILARAPIHPRASEEPVLPWFVEALIAPFGNPDEEVAFGEVDALEEAFLRHQVARYQWEERKRAWKWTVGEALPVAQALGDRYQRFHDGELSGVVLILSIPLVRIDRSEAWLSVQRQAAFEVDGEREIWVDDLHHRLRRTGDGWAAITG